jgi:hypothetical protein
VTRRLWPLAALGIVLGQAACTGSTDPATNVRATQARLNAHGYTNDGPARWWWEYDTVQAELGTANDTEVCGSGTRCGPAAGGSAGNQIALNTVVTGLTPNTTYYFRACGQDTNDAGPTCAQVRNFRTSRGDSTAAVSGGILTFTATAGTNNHVFVSLFTDSDGITKYQIEDAVDYSEFASFDGSSIVPGAGCQSFSGRPYDDAVRCPVAGITRIRVVLNDGDDNAGIHDAVTIPTTLEGGPGGDQLFGSEGANDTLITGPGGFAALGSNTTNGGGDDTIEAQNGAHDLVWCGAGDDVANVDGVDQSFEEIFGGGPPYASCEQLNEGP